MNDEKCLKKQIRKISINVNTCINLVKILQKKNDKRFKLEKKIKMFYKL